MHGGDHRMVGETSMTYQIKPLSCDPAKIKGMSERLIVSHYENNYGGAVKRLNLIEEQLAGLDYAKAAGFLINGLKREQLIAMNSMILHELFFDGLGDQAEPSAALREARGQRATESSSTNGRPIIATPWRAALRSSRSTCTSIPTTSILALRPEAMSTLSWTSSAGTTSNGCSFS